MGLEMAAATRGFGESGASLTAVSQSLNARW